MFKTEYIVDVFRQTSNKKLPQLGSTDSPYGRIRIWKPNLFQIGIRAMQKVPDLQHRCLGH
jgi:hypothetical protein